MSVNKVYPSFDEAVADIPDGASIMIGGFGGPGGCPQNLIKALDRQGAKDLTIIGCAPTISGLIPDRLKVSYVDAALLVEHRRVKKLIASFPFYSIVTRQSIVEQAYFNREFELEVVPQGTLIERIRAGGAGIGGFYTPTGVGTMAEYHIGGYYKKGVLPILEKKEKRVINGREYLFELPLRADYTFIWAYRADKFGNLVYRRACRSFSPVVATAAHITIAEVEKIVEPGELDPDHIHTPSVYVNRIIEVGGRIW
jgi:3-oxoacid CoA-transferase subunit A